MNYKKSKIEISSYIALGALFVSMGVSSLSLSMESLFAVSVLMFLTCGLNAIHLFGSSLTIRFVLLSLGVGFFAEYTGHHYGWFFGNYDFTDALGFRVLDVPIVIPLMWFNLTYMCYVLGNIILLRTPVDRFKSILWTGLSAAFGALLVTAYDLAADPYMVFVVKAWIMEKTDGWWFGETLQGFFGWFAVAFIILSAFKWMARKTLRNPNPDFRKTHALIPLSIFTCSMIFQMIYGFPVETRTISFFAMGIPLLSAFLSWNSWAWNDIKGSN